MLHLCWIQTCRKNMSHPFDVQFIYIYIYIHTHLIIDAYIYRIIDAFIYTYIHTIHVQLRIKHEYNIYNMTCLSILGESSATKNIAAQRSPSGAAAELVITWGRWLMVRLQNKMAGCNMENILEWEYGYHGNSYIYIYIYGIHGIYSGTWSCNRNSWNIFWKYSKMRI